MLSKEAGSLEDFMNICCFKKSRFSHPVAASQQRHFVSRSRRRSWGLTVVVIVCNLWTSFCANVAQWRGGGWGGLALLETVSHNKTVSYDKTFEASAAAWSDGAPRAERSPAPLPLLCLGPQPVPGTQSNRLHMDTPSWPPTTANNTWLCDGPQMVCSVLSFQRVFYMWITKSRHNC